MASFTDFLPLLLRFEGGFVDDPADPGGATNKGITIETFKQAATALLNIAPTLDALKTLSDIQAGIIYKTLYWDKLAADHLPDQNLASLLVDFYVNVGTNAIRVLQQELNAQNVTPPLQVDGEIGAKTLTALRSGDAVMIYRGLRQRRIDYYERLATENPASEKFLKGWLSRVNAFPVI